MLDKLLKYHWNNYWHIYAALCSISILIAFLAIVPRKLLWMWYAKKVNFQGKIVLITGASSGIGEEMTK